MVSENVHTHNGHGICIYWASKRVYKWAANAAAAFKTATLNLGYRTKGHLESETQEIHGKDESVGHFGDRGIPSHCCVCSGSEVRISHLWSECKIVRLFNYLTVRAAIHVQYTREKNMRSEITIVFYLQL